MDLCCWACLDEHFAQSLIAEERERLAVSAPAAPAPSTAPTLHEVPAASAAGLHVMHPGAMLLAEQVAEQVADWGAIRLG